MLPNKKFLRDCPLEIRMPRERVADFRKLLRVANESYVLNVVNESLDQDGIIFTIVCPMTSFAEAYMHLGRLCGQYWYNQIKSYL